mgnify:CR=1 FL=1
MNVKEMYRRIDGYLDTYGREEKSLITVLQAIQEEYSYLPKEIFPYLAKEMNLHEAQIYGVATFYENFSLEPKGKYVIGCCLGTACYVKGGEKILDALKSELKIGEGEVTPDGDETRIKPFALPVPDDTQPHQKEPKQPDNPDFSSLSFEELTRVYSKDKKNEEDRRDSDSENRFGKRIWPFGKKDK